MTSIARSNIPRLSRTEGQTHLARTSCLDQACGASGVLVGTPPRSVGTRDACCVRDGEPHLESCSGSVDELHPRAPTARERVDDRKSEAGAGRDAAAVA